MVRYAFGRQTHLSTKFKHVIRKYPDEWDKSYGLYGCGNVYSPWIDRLRKEPVSRLCTKEEIEKMPLCNTCRKWLERRS